MKFIFRWTTQGIRSRYSMFCNFQKFGAGKIVLMFLKKTLITEAAFISSKTVKTILL